MGENQHIEKLPNAPLKEVVFEIQWELNFDKESNKQYDPYFDLALGVFYESIKSDFDIVKRIVPPFFPKESLNFIPQFRFSKKNQSFPLIQLGEGVLSINDNDDNYHWKDSFYPLIVETLDKIFESYGNNIKISKVSLQYIDAVDYDSDRSADYLDFLAANLNYNVQRDLKLKGALKGFNFQEYIELENKNSLALTIGTGEDVTTKKRQLLWQYIISKESTQTKESILTWLSDAHETASTLFRNMLNPEFYDSFKNR